MLFIFTEVLCPPPLSPHHGNFSSAPDNLYQVGIAVAYTCEQGYVLKGHVISFCTQSGTWSHKTPTCKC